MKQHLLYWVREDEIDDNLIFKKAAERQEIFLRDEICTNLLRVPAFVVSTHYSKSVELPVYAFTMRNGIKVICRENFYGWKLSVELPGERPYAEILPEDIISEGYKGKRIPSCYFEGFEEKWCHCSYRPDVKQRKFSIGIYNDYKFYMAMYFLNHLYEPIKFNTEGDSLSKDKIAKSIRSIYEHFGVNDMRTTTRFGHPMEESVMKGWELLWITYSKLHDYDFREQKKLEYEDIMNIEDDPERFAEMILRFPELTERFLLEEWLYNQKF